MTTSKAQTLLQRQIDSCSQGATTTRNDRTMWRRLVGVLKEEDCNVNTNGNHHIKQTQFRHNPSGVTLQVIQSNYNLYTFTHTITKGTTLIGTYKSEEHLGNLVQGFTFIKANELNTLRKRGLI